MESTLNRLRPLFGDRLVEIRVGDEVPEVAIDVVQIDQVLTNLIENAIKFTPSGTPVSLSPLATLRGYESPCSIKAPVSRRKTGSGSSSPSRRGQVTESGTGLGLAISNAIVIAHGGRMWVSDNPLGGAAFTFELPSGDEPSSKEVSDARESARR